MIALMLLGERSIALELSFIQDRQSPFFRLQAARLPYRVDNDWVWSPLPNIVMTCIGRCSGCGYEDAL